MSIQTLRLSGLLSFAPDSTPLDLRDLNVLIGPNGSGKSNLIEALELLAAMPRDLLDVRLRRQASARLRPRPLFAWALPQHHGRMFGSTRFMAPEEFEKGHVIDERTTVFALGRTMTIFLGAAASTVATTACAEDPARRHPTVAALAADFAATAGRLRC